MKVQDCLNDLSAKIKLHFFKAYFGEKDYQQLRIIQQLVIQNNIPVNVIGCKTIREYDGLALSSRNAKLDLHSRKIASKIFERYSASSLANSLGSAQLTYGDYREYNKEIERFSKVSSDDIKRVANTYFIDKNLMVMHISPENLGFGKKLMMRLASLFM